MYLKKITAFSLVTVFLMTCLGACEQKEVGPAEQAGKKLDEAMQQAGKKMDEAMQQAGQKVDETMQQAGKQLDDVAKDLQQQ